MKITFILFCVSLIARCSFALTCEETFELPPQETLPKPSSVSPSATKFSPVKFLLKHRRGSVLGSRHDSMLGAGRAARGASENENPSRLLGLQRTQATFEVSNLLEIIDPLLGNGSSAPAPRKISLRMQNRDALDYVYENNGVTVHIPSESLKLIAEIVSLNRSEAHAGRLPHELSREFIKQWFEEAIQRAQKNPLPKTSNVLTFSIVELSYIDALLFDFHSQRMAHNEITTETMTLNYYRRVDILKRNLIGGKMEKILRTLALMVGRSSVDSVYDTFVKIVLARLENPKQTHIVDSTDDRQIEVPIQNEKLSKAFRYIANYYRRMSVWHVFQDKNSFTNIPGLDSKVPNSSELIQEFKLYSEARIEGRDFKKNAAVLAAILLIRIEEIMPINDFQEMAFQSKFRYLPEDTESILKMFPDVQAEFGLSNEETFRQIREVFEIAF